MYIQAVSCDFIMYTYNSTQEAGCSFSVLKLSREVGNSNSKTAPSHLCDGKEKKRVRSWLAQLLFVCISCLQPSQSVLRLRRISSCIPLTKFSAERSPLSDPQLDRPCPGPQLDRHPTPRHPRMPVCLYRIKIFEKHLEISRRICGQLSI